jgi:hypothetical protein
MKKTDLKEREATLPGMEPPKEAPEPKPPAKAKAAPKNAAGTSVVPHKPQPEHSPASLLELCLMAARDKSIAPDRLRAFLDMAKEQEQQEAETLFEEAMLAAQMEMPPVSRDAYNKQTKAWWARIETVAAKMDPIIRKHGFTLKYGMGDPRKDDHYYVFADVTWNGRLSSGKKSSFTRRYGMDVGRDDLGPKGTGVKTGAQGSVSVVTIGRRVLKMSIFDVVPLGMDNDGNRPAGRDIITFEQLKSLRKTLNDANIDEQIVCDFCHIDKLHNLGADQLQMVLDRAEQRKAMAS